MFGIEAVHKTWVDYVGIALAGTMVTLLAGLGLYGSTLGFLQSAAYLEANEWVAVGAGIVGAGCALYLLMELTGSIQARQVAVICLISGLFSIFAVTTGVPAAVTQLYGKPASVSFTVTEFGWGSRRCSRDVTAKNPDYEDFTMCMKYLDGTPRLGRTIEVRGIASGWGIVRERIIVR